MTSTITLPEKLYADLQQRAEQQHASPETLAVEVLQQYLSQHDQQWKQSFEALLAKVQTRSADIPSQEIEDDITAASLEVKELRREHRSVYLGAK